MDVTRAVVFCKVLRIGKSVQMVRASSKYILRQLDGRGPL